MLELAGDDRSVGAGIVIGSPFAWATDGARGWCGASAASSSEAEELFEAALRIAAEQGDPETASWTRGNLAAAAGDAGRPRRPASALARRNCELTERLGDVFSRSLALANLGAAQLAAGDYADALDSLEQAERLYREAMGNGGETEAWRAALRAEALLGVGRAEEALELAEWATRDRPRARHALGAAAGPAGARARARAASGRGRRRARRSTRRPRSPSGPAR